MHYPDQRSISQLTAIRREVNLPEEATGLVRHQEGKTVDIRDIVANGVIPTGYIIIDAMSYFGLKKAETLESLMLVEKGKAVDANVPIAGKNANRGKRLMSPVRGIVVDVDQGKVIMQEMPKLIDLEAGVRGRITSVNQGRGLVIESIGAQIHGAWGNNRRVISMLRLEPEAGLAQAVDDGIENRFTGSVVVTRRPITVESLKIMNEQTFAGLIGPSMDASLHEVAMRTEGVILLTEGFGSMRMSNATYTALADFEAQQVTVDAQMPNRWEARYPEILINRAAREGQRPSRPNALLGLRAGMTVHIIRQPYMGQSGRVLDLPKMPVLLDNGLRVLCAQVELTGGDTVYIPLANLEVLGR